MGEFDLGIASTTSASVSKNFSPFGTNLCLPTVSPKIVAVALPWPAAKTAVSFLFSLFFVLSPFFSLKNTSVWAITNFSIIFSFSSCSFVNFLIADNSGEVVDVLEEEIITEEDFEIFEADKDFDSDVDGDNDEDLLVVGEFMPVKVFINEVGKFIDQTVQSGLGKSNGWWNRLEAADVDKDGDIDFVIGNHGKNSRFRASVNKPVCMYVNDFDQNGTIEQLICTYNGDKSYPMALRHDLVSQVPSLKKKYLKYENYKNQTITDIFSPEQLRGALKLEAYEFSTSILINDGKGKFTLKALPVEAQFAPVFGIELADFDMDGSTDILLGGNFYKSKPEVGRYDASYGLLLQGNGKGDFTSRSARESGIRIEGEVRDIISMRAGKETLILVARNNEAIVTYKTNRK